MPSLPEGEPIPTPSVGEETETVAEENRLELSGMPIIGEREVVDGKMQSYLTGQWMDEEKARRRPIAVMIPNNAPALPQYGLSKAGIIYEAPVEGRITRLMAMFEDYDEVCEALGKALGVF